MIINCKITNTFMESDKMCIIRLTRKYLHCKFEFLTLEDWEGTEKYARFENVKSGVKRSAVIDADGMCLVPWECLTTEGYLKFSAHGERADGYTINTRVCRMLLEDTLDGGEDSRPPTPNLYMQMLEQRAKTNEIVQTVAQELSEEEKEQVRENIGFDETIDKMMPAIYPLPYYKEELSPTGFQIYRFVNIMELKTNLHYFAGKDINVEKNVNYRLVVVCDDGTEKLITFIVGATLWITENTNIGNRCVNSKDNNVIYEVMVSDISTANNVVVKRYPYAYYVPQLNGAKKGQVLVPTKLRDDAKEGIPVSYEWVDHIVPPTTAKVGQILSVKAVDDNGKPTEWEVINDACDWNTMQNKPFGEEEVADETLVFKRVYVGWYETTINELSYLKGTKRKVVMFNGSEYETEDCVETKNVPSVGITNGIQYIGNPKLIEDTGGIDLSNETKYTNYPFVVYSVFDGANDAWKETVVKFADGVTASMGESFDIYTLGGTVIIAHPIEEKFIPTNVPKVDSATEGQVAAVETVDENGKPLTWKPVDIPSGGGASIPVLKLSEVGTYENNIFTFNSNIPKMFIFLDDNTFRRESIYVCKYGEYDFGEFYPKKFNMFIEHDGFIYIKTEKEIFQYDKDTGAATRETYSFA